MSTMAFSAAYAYVARALGRSGDTDRQNAAKDAIYAAIEEWNIRKDWNFLRMDTSLGFSVTGCTSDGGTPATITTTSSRGFAGVNVGQTITNSASATSTVASITSSTVIVLSGALATGSGTMTFAGNIGIVAGTSKYNLPFPIKHVYSVRLLTNPRTLEYRPAMVIDTLYDYDQTGTGVPRFFNFENTASFSPNFENGVITVGPIPSVTDTMLIRYHRLISQPSADADLIDVPDRYVYALLSLARYFMLVNSDTDNPRTGEFKERAEFLFKKARWDDMSKNPMREIRFIPYVEWGGSQRDEPTLDYDPYV